MGLTVADIEVAVAFYGDVIGCEVVSPPESRTNPKVRHVVGIPDAKIRGAMLKTPDGELIELVMYEEPKKPPTLMETTSPSAVHLAFSRPRHRWHIGPAEESGLAAGFGARELGSRALWTVGTRLECFLSSSRRR